MSGASMFMACWGEPNEGYCASGGRLFDDLDKAIGYVEKQPEPSSEWVIFELAEIEPGVWEPFGYYDGP